MQVACHLCIGTGSVSSCCDSAFYAPEEDTNSRICFECSKETIVTSCPECDGTGVIEFIYDEPDED